MPTSIRSAPPVQSFNLHATLNETGPKLRLNDVRNGAGSPCAAPCGTSRTPGTHQQAVHSQALSHAIDALTKQHDADGTTSAERTALRRTMARLSDPSQPPLGTRVVNQLTVLGAVYAASSQKLEADSGNPFLIDLKSDLAKAIIDIGMAAERCGTAADGFYHGDGASKQLVAAINKAQGALANARATLGDQVLFNAMATTVMSSAMMASLNERLPQIAARFGDAAEVIDLMEVLQKQYAAETENAVNRQLSSGDTGDFVAAVFAFLKLPEYVLQACADQPVQDTPPAPEMPPAPDLPDLLRGLSGPQGGNQAINYSPNTNTNNIDVGRIGDKMCDLFNLGMKAGEEIGGLKARLEAAEKALQERNAGSPPTRAHNGDASAGTHVALPQPPLSHVGDGIEWPDGMSDSSVSTGTDASDMEVPLRNPLMTDPSYLQMRPTTLAQPRSDTFDFGEADHEQPVQQAIAHRLPSQQFARIVMVDAGADTRRPVMPGTATADDVLARYLREINTTDAEHGPRLGMRWSSERNKHVEDIQRADPNGEPGSVINPVEQVRVQDFLRFQQQAGETVVNGPAATRMVSVSSVDRSAPEGEFTRFLAERHRPDVAARGPEGSPTVNARQLRDFVAQRTSEKASESAQSLFAAARATAGALSDLADRVVVSQQEASMLLARNEDASETRAKLHAAARNVGAAMMDLVEEAASPAAVTARAVPVAFQWDAPGAQATPVFESRNADHRALFALSGAGRDPLTSSIPASPPPPGSDWAESSRLQQGQENRNFTFQDNDSISFDDRLNGDYDFSDEGTLV